MWFPSKSQWVVMWLGLVGATAAIYNAVAYYNEVWAAVFFAVVATAFLVWMVESRRRKP